MLVNWKVEYCDRILKDKQAPDYYVRGKQYWFFRYFKEHPDVDVIDISSSQWLENFEKNRLRFYVWQTIKVIPRLGKYDLVLSHGMQSGVVLSLWRRLFRTKAQHIVFDIGAFNSAAESGLALKMMQWASKSLDGVIYHTSMQREYYQEFFPWLLNFSAFIPFGTDIEWFLEKEQKIEAPKLEFILCIGYHKRDWDTLIKAYKLAQLERPLYFVGKTDLQIWNEKIRVIPFVKIEELLKLIKEAFYCVLPLEYMNYSFGQMTLQQQMLLGKAVITANVPSMKDYVLDGESALLYEAGNAEDLSEKLSVLSNNERLREKIGKNARKAVMQNFTEKTMAGRIEGFLNACMGRKNGNS